MAVNHLCRVCGDRHRGIARAPRSFGTEASEWLGNNQHISLRLSRPSGTYTLLGCSAAQFLLKLTWRKFTSYRVLFCPAEGFLAAHAPDPGLWQDLDSPAISHARQRSSAALHTLIRWSTSPHFQHSPDLSVAVQALELCPKA